MGILRHKSLDYKELFCTFASETGYGRGHKVPSFVEITSL